MVLAIYIWLTTEVAIAHEVSDEPKNALFRIIDAMPTDTILWVMAVFAILNGLSAGLEKIVRLTPTKADDKFLKYLKAFIEAARVVIDFCTAKGTKR